MPFSYHGPYQLTNGMRTTELRGDLAERQEYDEEIDRLGVVVRTPTLRSWGGVTRVVGLSPDLIDLLGGECTLILPDGRRARCFATGFMEEGSAWTIEIKGCGPAPR